MKKVEVKVARRYARALFDLSIDKGPDAIASGLSSFAQLWRENRELRNTLLNPGLPVHQRSLVLRDLAKVLMPGNAHLESLLCLLLENDRLRVVNEVVEEFASLIREARRELALEIWSARELSESERREMEDQIRGQLSREKAQFVTVTWRVDPSLIGGLKVRSGDRLLDGSVNGGLERMRKEMLAR